MKVFFYDGNLDTPFVESNVFGEAKRLAGKECGIVSASDGPSENRKTIALMDYDGAILTNSLMALNHWCGWNEEENHTDIYLWVDKLHTFKRIDELTDREIRRAHCVDKMYLAGSFNMEFGVEGDE